MPHGCVVHNWKGTGMMICGGHEDGALPPPDGTAERHADFRAAPPQGARGVHPLFASLVMGVPHA
eukprot:4093095-Prymnesium_polylepis.1